MEYWSGGDKLYILIPSNSRAGKWKLMEISDDEVCCVPADRVHSIIGTSDDEIVDCPACNYGIYCKKARKMMDILGIEWRHEV